MVAILDGDGVVARNGAMNRSQGWVLVVADDGTERMALFGLLEREGYRATVTDGTPEALELLRAEPFDVVVLSVVAERDAYTLLAAIQRDRQLHQIPVIIISGVAETDESAACVRLGTADWLYRPCAPGLLGARVAASVERRRLRAQEADYRNMMDQVAEVVRVRGDMFDAGALDLLSRRPDALGDLAWVFQQMSAELVRLRGQVTGPTDACQ
jgi:DNA-binding response OmpR family regulator